MQKSVSLWLLLFFTPLLLKAQQNTTLTANNVSANVGANGSLFSGGLQIPKGSGLSTIGTARLWIGGKKNGQIHIAAQFYDSAKRPDFWPGPLDTLGTAIAADTAAWNKIYKVSKQEIDFHKNNYKKPGYIIPDGIKNWPGTNPTTQPFATILAPFLDVGGNRKYEPEAGDYPDIKGDEAAYFIINDKANTHLSTGGLPLGVEIHGMVYVYANTPGLENTVFLEAYFINRSGNQYDSVFTGLWVDFSLGNPGDEYISSLPAKNAFYVYDYDMYDKGPGGYDSFPPTQAVVFLNKPLQYTIEIAKNNSMRGIPQNANEYYNFLRRHWRDGLPLVDVVDGYIGGNPTDYIYNGNPCTTTPWLEFGSGLQAGTRTMLGSMGPISLPPMGYTKLDAAFVYNRTPGYLQSICDLEKSIDTVKSFYQNNISSIGTKPAVPTFSIYPNPANTWVTIELNEINYNNNNQAQLEIMDLQGRIVTSQLIDNSFTTISTAHLQTGIYYIKIITDNVYSVQKLVIGR